MFQKNVGKILLQLMLMNKKSKINFDTIISVSIVDFEQVNVSWVEF